MKVAPEVALCNLSRTEPEGIPLEHVACDLRDEGQISAKFADVRAFLDKAPKDKPILLINNSGFGSCGEFPAPALDWHLDMLKVNIAAPVRLTGELLPLLKERGGAVINVASTAAFQPTPYMATYGGTKAFLLSWSLGLHQELKAQGVTVLGVCPGPTKTGFFKAAGFLNSPFSGQGETPEDVVRNTWKALHARRSLVISGLSNWLLAGFSGPLPKALQGPIAGMILRRARLDQHPG